MDNYISDGAETKSHNHSWRVGQIFTKQLWVRRQTVGNYIHVHNKSRLAPLSIRVGKKINHLKLTPESPTQGHKIRVICGK